MGWGIEYIGYINKVKIIELESKKEELEEFLINLRTEFVILSASQPHDVYDIAGDKIEWTDWLNRKLDVLWNNIIESSQELAVIDEAICSDNKKNI